MSDNTRSNLEPISDDDLALEKKFGHEENDAESLPVKNSAEQIISPEQKSEKIVESQKAYQKIISKVKSVKTVDENSIDDEAEVIGKEKDTETKVQSLVNIAENKGVIHAVKVARKMEDNYLLDELHDRLLGEELHDALLKKGLIEDV